MASIKYGQIDDIESILSEWWNVQGLPMALQKSLLSIKKALTENKATREELRQKLISDYSVRDENGEPVDVMQPVLNAKGEPVKNADGEPATVRVRKFTDIDAVNAQWDELVNTNFECPGIAESPIEPHVEKLGITLQKLEVIDSLIVE